jgi:DNA-binding XRE family transcriptional regulator
MTNILTRILSVDALLRRRHDPAVSELSEIVAKSFARKLRAARDKAGLTQEALGALSSVHRTEVSNLEMGHHIPRLDTVIRLAGALKIEPCDLVADVRWTPPPVGPSSGKFRKL